MVWSMKAPLVCGPGGEIGEEVYGLLRGVLGGKLLPGDCYVVPFWS